MKVDIELLTKYGRPGPRYTSYPTAPQFHAGFTAADFRKEIVETNRSEGLPDLSLYFHIPFCRQLCYFCACNTIITHRSELLEEYVVSLKTEIDMIADLIAPGRRVVQLHWGGGTPSYLAPAQIEDLFGKIQDRFEFAEDAEIGIEIDPRGLNDEHLPAIRGVGFNRVSFGVQDLNEQVQAAVNRVQPMELNRWVVERSRELGFESINIDLIYGLPYQTEASYNETLDKVLEISPDRLAVFNYAHVPWLKKHQKVIEESKLPSPTERLNILKTVIERLTGAGYAYIGMDHFAKHDDPMTVALNEGTLYRNFQGYTTHAEAEVYAMGVTAISQLQGVYAQNVKNRSEYNAMLQGGEIPTHVGYRLNDDDRLRRYVITELMCNNRLIKGEVEKRYGIDFDAYFANALARLKSFTGDGLLSLHKDRIQVHEPGRLVIRNIAMAFDRYLEQDEVDGRQKYSRTV